MSAFDEYLTKYCMKHEIDAKTAEKHAIVQFVRQSYDQAEMGKIQRQEDKNNGNRQRTIWGT